MSEPQAAVAGITITISQPAPDSEEPLRLSGRLIVSAEELALGDAAAWWRCLILFVDGEGDGPPLIAPIDVPEDKREEWQSEQELEDGSLGAAFAFEGLELPPLPGPRCHIRVIARHHVSDSVALPQG